MLERIDTPVRENTHTEFLAVGRGNTPTVYDPSFGGYRGRNSLGEEGTDFGLSLLGLCRGGDLAGTDRPDGFVGDDNVPNTKFSEQRTALYVRSGK